MYAKCKHSHSLSKIDCIFQQFHLYIEINVTHSHHYALFYLLGPTTPGIIWERIENRLYISPDHYFILWNLTWPVLFFHLNVVNFPYLWKERHLAFLTCINKKPLNSNLIFSPGISITLKLYKIGHESQQFRSNKRDGEDTLFLEEIFWGFLEE